MKNIDELIEKLAKHIEECLEKGSEYEGEIAEKTKALAELVSARAKMDKTETLSEYTKIVVETDEKNPTTIATVTSEDVTVVDGYRVRLTPTYD